MNDAVLLERWVQRRDAEAFNEIVARFADQVYGTCRNILRNDADAEEVAQECFLLLVRSGEDVRTSLGGWLHRVATTKSLDRIRSETRRRNHEQIHAEGAPHHMEANWDDIQEHVDAAIDTLPEELREAVVAHFIGRRSHLEIALELRLTRRAVSYRIQRGVEALRSELVRRGVTVSFAGLGALLLAQAAATAPLSLKASLGKLALAAGLPAGTGTGAATTANAAGSLILMKTKLTVAAAFVCVAAGVYLAIQPDKPEPPEVITTASGSDMTPNELEPVAVPTDTGTSEDATPAISAPDTAPIAEDSSSEIYGVISGVVLLPSGLPSQGVDVHYSWKPNTREAPVAGVIPHASAPVKTNAQGEFTLDSVPRGIIYVTAESEAGRVTERADVGIRELSPDITLVLKSGEGISGRVQSRDGKGIVGARIVPVFFNAKEPPDHEDEGLVAVSNSNGDFNIPHLKSGQWIFRVSAEGYGADLAGPWPMGTDNAQIVLSPGVKLECRVMRADQRVPLQGIQVTLTYEGKRVPFLTATSDEHGNAEFPSLGGGAYVLDIRDARFALDGPPVPINIDPARKIAGATLDVVPGGQIRGRITDANSGAGVAGVAVRAGSSVAGRTYTSAPSGEDGRYSLTGLPDGDYKITTGDLPPLYPRRSPGSRNDQTIAVTADHAIDSVDFVLNPGASFGGTVVDSEGNPVAGAMIRVNTERNRSVFDNVASQKDGTFMVCDYEAGELIWLSAGTRTAKSGRVGPFIAGDPGSDAIEVVLSRDCTGIIAGRVTDPQGHPFIGQIALKVDDPGLTSPVIVPRCETDGSGNFVLAELCEGSYQIGMTSDQGVRREGPSLRIKAGERLSDLRLVFDPGELFEIAGIVTDLNENPVAGVRIMANGQSAAQNLSEVSDENGAFHFKDLPAGRYSLMAYAEGYDEMQSLGIAEAGDMNARIVMIPLSTVSGRVTDVQGRPVSNYSISLYAVQNPEHVRANRRFSNADGSFSLESTANVELIMRVEAEGYATAEVELGSLRTARETPDVEVVLESAQ